MLRELSYNVVEVGEEFGPLEHTLDAPAMEKYLKGSGNTHPWHRGDSPFGPPIAPPTMLGNFSLRLMETKYYLPVGTLHAKQELEFLNPIRLDRRLISRGRIADKYIRRGREWIILDVDFSDQEGAPIAKSRVLFAMPNMQACSERSESIAQAKEGD